MGPAANSEAAVSGKGDYGRDSFCAGCDVKGFCHNKTHPAAVSEGAILGSGWFKPETRERFYCSTLLKVFLFLLFLNPK